MSLIGLNKNENYFYTSTNNDDDEEIESIIKNNKSISSDLKQHRSDVLFTPDSLESASTTSDDDADGSTLSTPSSSLIYENELSTDEQHAKLEIKKSEDSIEATESPTLVSSDLAFDNKEKKVQLISSKNEGILEKIRKINKLQDKINDINVKIKLSNQNSSKSKNNENKVNNYYCLANQVDDILDSFMSNEGSTPDAIDLIDNEKFFDYADHYFEPNILTNGDDDDAVNNIEDETFDYYFEDDTKFHEDHEGYFNDNNNDNLTRDDSEEDKNYNDDDDDDDDDDILKGNFKFCLKQAQPVHKKFASTGLLFYKFKYMDTIVEDEEIQADDVDDADKQSSQESKSRKGSISCFNLATRYSFDNDDDDDNNSYSSEVLIDKCISLTDKDEKHDDNVFIHFNKGECPHCVLIFDHMKLIINLFKLFFKLFCLFQEVHSSNRNEENTKNDLSLDDEEEDDDDTTEVCNVQNRKEEKCKQYIKSI